jgi:uncharacterized membrane protein
MSEEWLPVMMLTAFVGGGLAGLCRWIVVSIILCILVVPLNIVGWYAFAFLRTRDGQFTLYEYILTILITFWGFFLFSFLPAVIGCIVGRAAMKKVREDSKKTTHSEYDAA